MDHRHTTAEERRIVSRLVKIAITKGYAISVNDGEEWTVKKSRDENAILSALATTGMDVLRFRLADARIGDITLIWGNDEDVISDSTDNEEMAAIISHALHYTVPRIKLTGRIGGWPE